MSNNADAEYEDEAFQEGGSNEESTREKRKRKRKGPPVKRACLNCRKSHVSCSEQRPCHRCVAKGIPCIDASSTKQQTASLEALLLNLAQNIGTNVVQQQQQQQPPTNFHTSSTSQTPAPTLNFNFDNSSSNSNNNASSMQNIPSFLLPLVMQQQQASQQQQHQQQQQQQPQVNTSPPLSYNSLLQPSTPVPNSSTSSVNIINAINTSSSRNSYFPAPHMNNGVSNNAAAAEAFLDKVMLQQRISALEQELSELKLAKQQQQQMLTYGEPGRHGLQEGMFSRMFQKYKTPVTVWDTKTTLLSCNEAFAMMIKEDSDQSKRKMNAGSFNIVKNAKAETASFALLIMDTVYQVKKQASSETAPSLPLIEYVKITDALKDYYGNTIFVEHTVNFEPGFFWIESVPLTTDHYDDQIEIDNQVVHPKTMEIRPTNHNFKMQVLQKMCMVLQHLEQAAQKKKQLQLGSSSSSNGYPSPSAFNLKFGTM